MGTSSVISGAGKGIAAGSAFGPYGALAGGVTGALGGLFSDEGGDNSDLYKQYLAQLQGVTLPSLDELTAAGHISGTAYDQIQEDPATRQATMDALQGLQAEGESGGQSVQSKAAMAGALNEARQAERMQAASIMEDMARRGQSGGGAELVAREMANQGQASRANAAGVQAAADDRTRALNALVQAGNLGSTVRGQDNSIASQKASARDTLAQWNAKNATSALGNRTNWQLEKASGASPAYAGIAAGNNQDRSNAIGTADAAGALGAGVYGMASGAKKIKGYDASGNPIYETA